MLFSFISSHTFSLSHFQSKNNISKYFIHYVTAHERMQYLTLNLRQESQDLHEEGGWVPDLTMGRANSCWYYREHCCGRYAQTSLLFGASLSIDPTEHLSKIEYWWSVPRALSITHNRTTIPWQSRGHSGLWGQQETTLAAKGSSSAATVLRCCCRQSAQPPYDSIIILFRQEDQGSLTLG